MTITLESIKSEQTGMIAALESSAERTNTIPLNPGEEYAGIIIGKEGQPDHHLILLPGESESMNWNSAKEWAAEAGGELPTRREQSLLYANLKEHFKSDWYWSGEQPAASSGYAWCQYFGSGLQDYVRKGHECRARAVRRVAGGAGPRQAARGEVTPCSLLLKRHNA